MSININKMKEAATTIKKRTDTTKGDLAESQPASVTDSLRKKADALRKEVSMLVSGVYSKFTLTSTLWNYDTCCVCTVYTVYC